MNVSSELADGTQISKADAQKLEEVLAPRCPRCGRFEMLCEGGRYRPASCTCREAEQKLAYMTQSKNTGWGYFREEQQRRMDMAEAAVRLADACRSGDGVDEALAAFERVGKPVCLVCSAFGTCSGTPEKCLEEMAEEETSGE